MSEFLDDLCRILATPMPRSRALKLIAGGLASVAFAPFAFGQRGLQCPPDQVCQGAPTNCCPGNQKCCAGTGRGGRGFCCPKSQECCGAAGCCLPNEVCMDGTCQANPSRTRP